MDAVEQKAAFFDSIVRDVVPPLRNPRVLGRISLNLICATLNILISHCFTWPRYGFLSFIVYVAVAHIFLVMDTLTSNSFGQNVRNLRKAGYRDATILAIMEFNLVSSQLIGYFIIVFVVADPSVYTLDYVVTRMSDPVAVSKLLMAVVANLTLSEVLFMASHSIMHKSQNLLKLHIFHHCCVNPSWTTNILFHPVDLMMEFAGPAGGLLAMHFLCWNQEPLQLVFTYVIFQVWYAWDHDEHVQLWHAKHHTLCDSAYGVYSPIKGNPKENELKKYMLGKGLLKSKSV